MYHTLSEKQVEVLQWSLCGQTDQTATMHVYYTLFEKRVEVLQWSLCGQTDQTTTMHMYHTLSEKRVEVVQWFFLEAKQTITHIYVTLCLRNK